MISNNPRLEVHLHLWHFFPIDAALQTSEHVPRITSSHDLTVECIEIA